MGHFQKRSMSNPAAGGNKNQEALIRQSFEEKGYSMRLQSTRTKALAETQDITDSKLKNETVRNVNKLGKNLISDLKISKWTENDNEVLKYIQAIVAVSPPAIPFAKDTEYEFEEDLTSQPMLDLKRSKRHEKTREILERDPMIIVPKEQVQGLPGLIENELCTFDFFTHSVKPARSLKKDLLAFEKKRAKYTISNLKLPELDGKESKYRPLKYIEPIENSASLKYTRAMAVQDKKAARTKDEG